MTMGYLEMKEIKSYMLVLVAAGNNTDHLALYDLRVAYRYSFSLVTECLRKLPGAQTEPSLKHVSDCSLLTVQMVFLGEDRTGRRRNVSTSPLKT